MAFDACRSLKACSGDVRDREPKVKNQARS
jgi:hypothetical protein